MTHRTKVLLASFGVVAIALGILFWAASHPSQNQLNEAVLDAASAGYSGALDAALARGGNPNARTRQLGVPALILAGVGGNVEAVRVLLDHGADPNIQNRSGVAALEGIASARQRNFREVCQVLIDRGAQRPPQEWLDDELLDTFENHQYWRARSLLACGADPDVRFKGTPFLMIAGIQGDLEMVKVLLEYGADPNVTTSNGVTALQIIARGQQKNYRQICAALVESGAHAESGKR